VNYAFKCGFTSHTVFVDPETLTSSFNNSLKQDITAGSLYNKWKTLDFFLYSLSWLSVCYSMANFEQRRDFADVHNPTLMKNWSVSLFSLFDPFLFLSEY